MYEGWIKVKRGQVLTADCYPRLISAPISYARLVFSAVDNYPLVLYLAGDSL